VTTACQARKHISNGLIESLNVLKDAYARDKIKRT
jgi:hypothetical protein